MQVKLWNFPKKPGLEGFWSVGLPGYGLGLKAGQVAILAGRGKGNDGLAAVSSSPAAVGRRGLRQKRFWSGSFSLEDVLLNLITQFPLDLLEFSLN